MTRPPISVLELAARTVDQVRAALGVELTYDSETLPVIDHYLRAVPREQRDTVLLIAATAGAYFGEVVRRSLGGEWLVDDQRPADSRLQLPWGLSFSPIAIVASAVLVTDELDDLFELDTRFHAPEPMLAYLRASLDCMSPVSEEEYYSLCGRFDTLAHLHEVVPARARSN